jgi:ATP-dependent exoDNAse (exonuclease V) alpha subunit
MEPDKLARLMKGLDLHARAKMIGAEPMTREEHRTFNHVAASNSTETRVLEKVAPTINSIHFEGAPQSLDESGLIDLTMKLDESQHAAITTLVNTVSVIQIGTKYVCLIGSAGTGKTTMIKRAIGIMIYGHPDFPNVKPIGINRLDGDQGPSIAICAFTGIATQVIRATLPEWLHPACKTLHSLLEYKPAMGMEDMQGRKAMFIPTRTARNKLKHKVIVIDETSMLGLDLWHNVIDACEPGTIIFLIGDLNQLKPVADATFFAYALSAGIDKKYGWDIAELTTIHRQKEPEANKIIDGAHAILNGKQPVFDNPQVDPNWRFIGFELPPQASVAHNQIAAAIDFLRKTPTPGDPTRPIFDPYKDLLLCAGNGYDENDSSSFVQQAPLNGTLSRMIEPPTEEHPVYFIDAGRETRRFAVGHRVMATKNESPDVKDRVTNGLTGRIIDIRTNSNWKGNRSMFGTEQEVMAWRKKMAANLMSSQSAAANALGVDLTAFKLESVDTSRFEAKDKEEERQSSHIITIKFANGAERTYRTAVDVGAIQLAYAMTVHKAQGSQADTVVVVIHHAVKRQLSREWIYTATTRARRRVVFLYTKMGLATAISRQQIYGTSLREKVNRYRQVMEAGNTFVRLRARDVTFERDHDDI